MSTQKPVATNSGDEFTIGLLNGVEMLNKHTDGSLASTSEFAAFVKKLAKLEASFGKELSQLCAKDGKKLLTLPHLTGYAARAHALTHAHLPSQ